MSVAAAQDMLFGTNTPGINIAGALQEASYGQVQVNGAVLGTYNLTETTRLARTLKAPCEMLPLQLRFQQV
jgi:hypothetical protein